MAAEKLGDSTVLSKDELVLSNDAQHPANLICELCRKFYRLGWVQKLYLKKPAFTTF